MRVRLGTWTRRHRADERGATAIEYGLIAALIAVAIIVGAGALGTAINEKFLAIETEVKNAG